MPIFFQSGKPLKRRGGAFALAVAVMCFLLAAGVHGFAVDIAPGVVPGGDNAVSERPKVLDHVDESAFSTAPPSLPKDESASLPGGMPDVAPSETPSPDAGVQAVQSPPDPTSPDTAGSSPAQARRPPVSADTVGPPPAALPEKDDLPSAAADPPAASSASAASKIKLFGTVEFKRPLSSLPAWLDLLKRNQADPIFLPEKHFNKKVTWAQFKEKAKGKNTMDLLRYVNSFWNTWPYREDIDNWGQEDYWEIPAEFLKKSGDCEDYSIIKYFTLKELGIPPETMRIVVVRDTIRNMAHAVLVVYMNNDAYVLDSLSNAVLSHTRFSHYSPQYSVNEFGRWAHLKGRKLK